MLYSQRRKNRWHSGTFIPLLITFCFLMTVTLCTTIRHLFHLCTSTLLVWVLIKKPFLAQKQKTWVEYLWKKTERNFEWYVLRLWYLEPVVDTKIHWTIDFPMTHNHFGSSWNFTSMFDWRQNSTLLDSFPDTHPLAQQSTPSLGSSGYLCIPARPGYL